MEHAPLPPAHPAPPSPPRRPGDRWRVAVQTFGGAGLSPAAPGTAGSLAAALLLGGGLWLARAGEAAPPVLHGAVAAWVLVAGVACVALGPWAQRYFRASDPPPVVMDEVAGMGVALAWWPAAAMATGGYWALWVATAFAFFRLFDILKPPPLRRLERLPAGWGILLDDVAAGVLANFCTRGLFAVLPA